jgi:hypothetical protein
MADIQHSIPIAANPEAIYPLVATAKGFGQWWASDITERDGAVELGFFNRATLYRVRLEVSQRPAHAVWICETGDEWNGTHLDFRLSESKSGTLLKFAHAGWRSPSDYFIACNTTWGELMYRLKAAAEGNSRGPLFLPGSMAY